MAGSTRIKGAQLTLKFGTPGLDYKCDTTAVTLENEEADSDVQTFCDAAEGGARTFFFNITLIQSLQSTSFWRYAWESTGELIPFTYAPLGNEVATADAPHFVGMVKVGPKPTIGGEAGASNTFTSEVRWDVEGAPTLDDGTP